jgi:hypothetical protein
VSYLVQRHDPRTTYYYCVHCGRDPHTDYRYYFYCGRNLCTTCLRLVALRIICILLHTIVATSRATLTIPRVLGMWPANYDEDYTSYSYYYKHWERDPRSTLISTRTRRYPCLSFRRGVPAQLCVFNTFVFGPFVLCSEPCPCCYWV